MCDQSAPTSSWSFAGSPDQVPAGGEPAGDNETMIDFDVGQLLLRAVESSGTNGFVSG